MKAVLDFALNQIQKFCKQFLSFKDSEILAHFQTFQSFVSKSNLHYTCGITSKRVTRGGTISPAWRLGNIATKKRGSGGEPLATLSDLTGPGIEPQTSSTNSIALKSCCDIIGGLLTILQGHDVGYMSKINGQQVLRMIQSVNSK